MRVDLVQWLTPGFAMTANAAVPGQPAPVFTITGQRAGEMGAEGAVDGRDFVILKQNRYPGGNW